MTREEKLKEIGFRKICGKAYLCDKYYYNYGIGFLLQPYRKMWRFLMFEHFKSISKDLITGETKYSFEKLEVLYKCEGFELMVDVLRDRMGILEAEIERLKKEGAE